MFPDTVLRQVLDNLIPEHWDSHPTKMHGPKLQTKVILWLQRSKALLSLRLVCKQWDSMVSDVLATKVHFVELNSWSGQPLDTFLWLLASMARSNSFPSWRLLEHARGAVRSICSSFHVQDETPLLWRAPFMAQRAYYGRQRQPQPKDLRGRSSPDTTATCYLPVMIFCGIEDLHEEIDNQEDINAADEFFGRPLFAAVYEENERVTSMLLESGADVNAPGGVFHSVLQLASSQGSTSIMKLLLQAGANVNDEGGPFGNALVAAVSCNHKSALELLLAHGASPHLPEVLGTLHRSPLLVAAGQGHVGVVDRLLEIEDIDVNFKNQSMETPLRQALRNGHCFIAERLASDPRIDKQYAFHTAAYFGNLRIVQFLVERRGVHPDSVDEWGESVILSALHSKSDETATYLLAKCTFDDPNCSAGWEGSAVDVAAQNGLENAVRILLRKGADISKNSEGKCRALWEAAGQGHERVVDLLLEHGADPTAPPPGGGSPLMEAASGGHVGVIKMLLDRPDVDVNYRGHRNRTPLLEAATFGHCEAVRVILDSGAEINTPNGFGLTALSFAAINGKTDVVRLLLSYGAQVDKEGGVSEKTGLDRAVHYEHVPIVEMLLSHGANVNSVDRDFGRPLYSAVWNRHEEMVRLLLRRKDIELDAKDSRDGLTALELAVEKGYEEIATLLLERGAVLPERRVQAQSPETVARPNL